MVAGEQFAYLKLSTRGTVTAQVYVRGAARPIRWRRTLPAGTSPVRIPIADVDRAAGFTIVLRGTNGTGKSMAKLKLTAESNAARAYDGSRASGAGVEWLDLGLFGTTGEPATGSSSFSRDLGPRRHRLERTVIVVA